MSPRFEELVVFGVMSILVALFGWIYARDRETSVGLWMLGWIAIFIHFAAPAVDDYFLSLQPYTSWIKVFTLIIAGSCFLLSVSQVFAERRRRFSFVIFISTASVLYLSGLSAGVKSPWFFAGLLTISTVYAVIQAIGYYGWRSAHLYYVLLLAPYGVWATVRALQGSVWHGLDFYLFGFFYVTGLVYFRRFHRFTPGVIFTSASFMAWGCVFPLAAFCYLRGIGPSSVSFFWDIPKFFVAFGMILTLFENKTEVANAIARQCQALFENNLAAVYVSTFDGRLLDCNSAFLRMYGFSSKEDALSRPAERFYSQPSDREEFLKDLDREGKVVNYECMQRRKDGSDFWILERAVIIPGADGEELIEGTAIDITERKQSELALKQSEERFATIFRQSLVGCAILTVDGTFLSVNDTFLRLLSLPAEKVIGNNSVDLGMWSSRQERDKVIEKILAEHSVQNVEIKFKDAEGEQHVGVVFATLVRIGDKDCILAMLLDQTEERELEAKFLQAQKMEALGRLAGGVAHDFNNMLGVIGGYAELLESKLEINEGLRRYCTKILETTQRASGLTKQLLTFSRKEVVRPTPLETSQALMELTAILRRLIGEDIELIVNLQATGTVVIDKTHFEQIILNIVINSRDAMPAGGQLFIETEDIVRPLLTPDGNVLIRQYAAIRIRDTGVGMDETTRQHAFEPFYTTKEVGRGTGLGLATVYGIVQQCQGEIAIESAPRKGTQINILLPVTSEPTSTPGQDVSQHILKKGQGRILLVEDEAELRSVNAEFLSALGYKLLCAGSGAEALEIAMQQEQIDLVISDVVMPKMGGREFTNRLLQLRPNTKLLYVSGYADDVVLHSGIPTQGFAFLQKPFTLRQLASTVQSLLSVSSRTA
jgi:PAS domain S-box-containing protein